MASYVDPIAQARDVTAKARIASEVFNDGDPTLIRRVERLERLVAAILDYVPDVAETIAMLDIAYAVEHDGKTLSNIAKRINPSD